VPGQWHSLSEPQALASGDALFEPQALASGDALFEPQAPASGDSLFEPQTPASDDASVRLCTEPDASAYGSVGTANKVSAIGHRARVLVIARPRTLIPGADTRR